MGQTGYCRIIATLLCVAIALPGCVHYKRPHLLIKVPEFYEHRTRLDDLTLAADPYFEWSKIEYLFNTNLLKKGFLAVHFIAFNFGDKTYDLKGAGFALVRDDGVQLKPLSPKEVSKKVLRHTSLRMAGWGFAGLIVLSIPFSIAAGIDSFRTNQQIKKAVTEDVLRVFEIGPKEVVDGFYFFQLGRTWREKRQMLNHQYQLEITGVVDSDTKERYEFLIGLN